MADFSIRSLQFKNAASLTFSSLNALDVLVYDRGASDFGKVRLDTLLDPSSGVIISDVHTDGIVFDYNLTDRKHHISKDYTDIELGQLNLIRVYLENMSNSNVCSSCSSSCIHIASSASHA